MSRLKIAIYNVSRHKRGRIIAEAMIAGFARHGVQTVACDRFTGRQGDIALAYGWNHKAIFDSYPDYLYFDLGFWDRKPQGNPKEGAHRLCVSSWSPVDRMKLGRPHDRFKVSGIELLPETKGRDILVAGMSPKASRFYGFTFNKWEEDAIQAIRTFTKRRIVLRAKPTKTLPGIPVIEALRQSSVVVSYHSNIAVDAMIYGTANYTEKGIGTMVSIPSLKDIDTAKPPSYETRKQFLSDVAYCQWTPEEMRNGEVWQDVKDSILCK